MAFLDHTHRGAGLDNEHMTALAQLCGGSLRQKSPLSR